MGQKDQGKASNFGEHLGMTFLISSILLQSAHLSLWAEPDPKRDPMQFILYFICVILGCQVLAGSWELCTAQHLSESASSSKFGEPS